MTIFYVLYNIYMSIYACIHKYIYFNTTVALLHLDLPLSLYSATVKSKGREILSAVYARSARTTKPILIIQVSID